MSTPARILHEIAGRPELTGFDLAKKAAPCKICGLPAERSQAFARWLPPTATDWDSWRGPSTSTVVCEACAWLRGGKPAATIHCPPGGALPGYAGPIPYPLRLYAHVWDEIRGWRWGTLSHKAMLRQWLLDSLSCPAGTRWFAAMSDGGTSAKQSLAHCEVNAARQPSAQVVLQMERVTIHMDREQTTVWGCMELVDWAYQFGWSKAEIEAGQASSWRMGELGIAECREIARGLRRYVGSSELALAVWLTQREQETAGAQGSSVEQEEERSETQRLEEPQEVRHAGGPEGSPAGGSVPSTAGG